ncbi:MAG: MTH1187 family thiamine-binding protein [Ignavibacteriaceae bacterium]|nr:MTH1187 family thiamine-binding protein [Ignavibacteriaceae bacterium]
MIVLCDFNLVTIGDGTSISKYIVECHKIFQKHGLKTNIHAFGTNIEGTWDDISSAIAECHNLIHDLGVKRILSTIKLSTRNDREQNIQEKIDAVKNHL